MKKNVCEHTIKRNTHKENTTTAPTFFGWMLHWQYTKWLGKNAFNTKWFHRNSHGKQNRETTCARRGRTICMRIVVYSRKWCQLNGYDSVDSHLPSTLCPIDLSIIVKLSNEFVILVFTYLGHILSHTCMHTFPYIFFYLFFFIYIFFIGLISNEKKNKINKEQLKQKHNKSPVLRSW